MNWGRAFIAFCLIPNAYALDIDHTRFNVLPEEAKSIVMEKIDGFMGLKSSVEGGVPEDFNKMKTKIKINAPLEKVWKAYTEVGPSEVWKGPRVNFVFAYSKSEDKAYYVGDQAPSFRPGLRVLNFLHLAGEYLTVGVEVARVDHEQKILELNYLEGNASKGTQVLEFEEIGENLTMIKHYSFYKSESNFRDQVIYPVFHRLTTNEHHGRMLEIIEGEGEDQ